MTKESFLQVLYEWQMEEESEWINERGGEVEVEFIL
jgi:hypothetical protein